MTWQKAIDGLRRLDEDCAPFIPDQRIRATILIHACIASGLDDGSLIFAALTELGLDSNLVGRVLQRGTGRWVRNREGRYRNHHE